MNSHLVKPHTCPGCGSVHNAATSITEDKAGPAPGDLSVCILCGTVCVFEELGLRRATRADIATLEPEEALALGKAVGAVKLYRNKQAKRQ